MTFDLRRRDFLKGSAAVAGAAVAGSFTCVEVAKAAKARWLLISGSR